MIYAAILLGAGPALSKATQRALSALLHDLFSEIQPWAGESEIGAADLLSLGVHLARLLEASEYTNAGRGSELTSQGTVECDASVILHSRQTHWVSVGAVPDIQHPTALCAGIVLKLLRHDQTRTSWPKFICGMGARDFGLTHKLVSPNYDLVTDRARKAYTRWKDADNFEDDSDRFVDTVGLILVSGDTICTISSSGGSLLRNSGRIGPAALVGCGLDVANNSAAICSGFGEDIITARLAARALTTDELNALPAQIDLLALQRPPAQYGVLRMSRLEGGVAVDWVHTTESMICGYGSFSPNKAETKIEVSKEPAQGGAFLK